MQNNIPAQLIAAVAIPENHHQDLDAVSCRWQPLGFYADREAAQQACLTFIAALSDDLKEWAGFAVLTPENGSYARIAAAKTDSATPTTNMAAATSATNAPPKAAAALTC